MAHEVRASRPAAFMVTALLALATLMTISRAQNSFSCGKILDSGVYNTYSHRENASDAFLGQQAACEDYSSYTYNQYLEDNSSRNYASRSDSFNLAVSVAFRFGLFKFGAGVRTGSSSSSTTLDEYAFSQAKTAIAAYRSSACISSTVSSANSGTLEVLRLNIEPIVYEAYLRCLEMSEKGLQIATTFGAGGNSVDISLRFMPTQAGARASLVNVVVYPADGAFCSFFVPTRQLITRLPLIDNIDDEAVLVGASVLSKEEAGSMTSNNAADANPGAGMQHGKVFSGGRGTNHAETEGMEATGAKGDSRRRLSQLTSPPPRPPQPQPAIPLNVELKELVYYTIQCYVDPSQVGSLMAGGRDTVEISVVTTVANSFRTQLYTSAPPTAEDVALAAQITELEADLSAQAAALAANLSARISTLEASLRTRLSALDDSLTGRFAALSGNLTGRVSALNTNLTARLATLELQARLLSHVVGGSEGVRSSTGLPWGDAWMRGFPNRGQSYIWSRSGGSVEEHPVLFKTFDMDRDRNLRFEGAADDVAIIFVDGVYRGSCVWPNQCYLNFRLAAGSHTLVARCRNTGQGQGFAAALMDTDTGEIVLRTDSSWRFTVGPAAIPR